MFLADTALAQCPTTTPVAPGAPKCADYPDGYLINDFTNCQAYFFCPNATSPPYARKCSEPFNFDQNHQICNHPDNYTCPSDQCVAQAGKFNVNLLCNKDPNSSFSTSKKTNPEKL